MTWRRWVAGAAIGLVPSATLAGTFRWLFERGITEKQQRKPIRTVVAGFPDPPTADDIATLTAHLTGCKPTAEEMAEVKWILAEPAP